MSSEIVKNPLGYYEVIPKPSEKELQNYYHDKYYQDNLKYENSYTLNEVKYLKNRNEQKQFILNNYSGINYSSGTILDIGCGEGWTISFFQDLGFNVTGLDYSTHGILTHNPNLAEKIICGDIYENIQQLIKDNKKYDIIWLDNLLEHVIDPLSLLEDCKKLATANTTLVIEVPNDFSTSQMKLLNEGKIPNEFWVVLPDHLNYFSKESLDNISLKAGWTNYYSIADFPIDFFLFNADSNYVIDKTKGKNCHFARVEIDNMFHSISVENTVQYYKSLALMGIGRQIISFYRFTNI
ncbi:MAG: class I SAM-dependent methyltransferase [Bacteroidia bacterium]|nr:class I SAM-dependent methyltransferase [Bacteroidia bacterium]